MYLQKFRTLSGVLVTVVYQQEFSYKIRECNVLLTVLVVMNQQRT